MNSEMFMKENAVGGGNEKYIASKGYTDDDGQPIEWELRKFSYSEIEELILNCPNAMQKDLSTGFPKVVNVIVENTVVKPNLNDIKLQDKYGVLSKEELLKAMLTEDEYYNLFEKVRLIFIEEVQK